MMAEGNDSKKVLLSVLAVAILIVAVVGVSYAAFTATNTGNANTITTGEITMSYAEPNSILAITNALPMTEDSSKAEPYFEFTVSSHARTNADDTVGVTINYEINVTPIALVEETDGTCADGVSTNKTACLAAASTWTAYTALAPASVRLGLSVGASSEYVAVVAGDAAHSTIRTDSVKVYETSEAFTAGRAAVTTTYRMRMWIDNTVDPASFTGGETFKMKVNVNGSAAPVSTTPGA